MVDAVLDRELDEQAEARLERILRRDPVRRQELAGLARVVGLLGRPCDGPDLTARILDGVDRRRGFLPPRWRAVVRSARLGLAAAALIALAALAITRRVSPERVDWIGRPAPVSRVVEAGQDAIAGLGQAARRVDASAQRVSAGIGSFMDYAVRLRPERPAPADTPAWRTTPRFAAEVGAGPGPAGVVLVALGRPGIATGADRVVVFDRISSMTKRAGRSGKTSVRSRRAGFCSPCDQRDVILIGSVLGGGESRIDLNRLSETEALGVGSAGDR